MFIAVLGFELGFCVFSVGYCEFGCQYQCSQLPAKTRLWNDLLCVEWHFKLY